MKKVILLLLVLPLWAGCGPKLQLHTTEFSHTGCNSGIATKASSSDCPRLILKYDNGGLRVSCTNAEMNCAIKLNGIACDVSMDGDVIHYYVYEKDGPSANCFCHVDEMTSVVNGLQKGKDYTLDFVCSAYRYMPIPFTFNDGLYLVLELTRDMLVHNMY